MCSKTVPTENQIQIKTKEIHFSLFYFHFNYIVALPIIWRKQGFFFKLLVIGKWWKQALIIQIFDYFFQRINKHKNKQSCISKDCRKYLIKGHDKQHKNLNGSANLLMFKSNKPGWLCIVKVNRCNHLINGRLQAITNWRLPTTMD